MLAFTICSNNYLAQAKTLGDSWLQYHPDFSFKIVLADVVNPAIDYSFCPYEIVLAHELGISYFKELVQKYGVVELNTAIKPDAFIFLFNSTHSDCIVYLDPDILIFSKLTELIDSMNLHRFAVTPHMISCVPDDGESPTDHEILRTGLFNLGFLALRKSEEVSQFLLWWKSKLRNYCFVDWQANYFYDQSWVSYLPCLWDNYIILKHPGYNMAYWNLHERRVSLLAPHGLYLVNYTSQLRFYHFSDFKPDNPSVLSAHTTRYSFSTRPDLVPLYLEYSRLLRDNHYELLRGMPYGYRLDQA